MVCGGRKNTILDQNFWEEERNGDRSFHRNISKVHRRNVPRWISDAKNQDLALSRTIFRQPLIYNMLLLCAGFQIFQSYLLQSSNASQSYAMILIVKINNNDVL